MPKCLKDGWGGKCPACDGSTCIDPVRPTVAADDALSDAGLGVPPWTADEWCRYYDARRAKADDALSEAGLGVPEYKRPMTLRECMEAEEPAPETVDHPSHYGGADNPYEAIKVIEAWDLGFCLGNTVKYLSRAGKKGSRLEDLRKAAWYLQREIETLAGRE